MAEDMGVAVVAVVSSFVITARALQPWSFAIIAPDRSFTAAATSA